VEIHYVIVRLMTANRMVRQIRAELFSFNRGNIARIIALRGRNHFRVGAKSLAILQIVFKTAGL
jgi:hypothetical protein